MTRTGIAFAGVMALAAATTIGGTLSAQGQAQGQGGVQGQQGGRQGGAPAPPPATAQSTAPIDLTGYWVAVVTEDWRWRMVTPPKGDFSSIPLNAAGQKVVNSWDPATDGSCQAYGAAGIMRMPTRLHITWENDSTLKIDTDAGVQTRRLVFNPATQPGPRSLQGFSRAVWQRPGGGGAGRGGNAGDLMVTTTNTNGGWLRKNGVPYSPQTTLTEYFDTYRLPNGDDWLVHTQITSDPMYLNQDWVISSHFKKEPDNSKWAPSPCRS